MKLDPKKLTVEQCIAGLQNAGMSVEIIIKDARAQGLTLGQLRSRWGRSETFIKKLLKDPDCLLEVKTPGSKGRGRSAVYYGHSVELEESRLRKLRRIP